MIKSTHYQTNRPIMPNQRPISITGYLSYLLPYFLYFSLRHFTFPSYRLDSNTPLQNRLPTQQPTHPCAISNELYAHKQTFLLDITFIPNALILSLSDSETKGIFSCQIRLLCFRCSRILQPDFVDIYPVYLISTWLCKNPM